MNCPLIETVVLVKFFGDPEAESGENVCTARELKSQKFYDKHTIQEGLKSNTKILPSNAKLRYDHKTKHFQVVEITRDWILVDFQNKSNLQLKPQQSVWEKKQFARICGCKANELLGSKVGVVN